MLTKNRYREPGWSCIIKTGQGEVLWTRILHRIEKMQDEGVGVAGSSLGSQDIIREGAAVSKPLGGFYEK